MAECLREVAKHHVPLRIEFLGKEPQVVCGTHGFQQQFLGLEQPAGAGEAFDEPEVTKDKPALLSFQSVFVQVSPQEVSVHQFFPAGIDRSLYSFVFEGQEVDQRQKEKAGVEIAGAIALHEGVFFRVVSFCENIFPDRRTLLDPSLHRGFEAVAFRDGDAPVERYPAHHLGVDEVVWAVADLPDAVVRFFPVFHGQSADVAKEGPELFIYLSGVVREAERCVHDLAVDIPLVLGMGEVADAYRPGVPVAFQVFELLFPQERFAFERIHDPEVFSAMPAVDRMEPANEAVRLHDVTEGKKCLERERGVSQPGKAVIPVSFAAD